jgi:hypothetical protein
VDNRGAISIAQQGDYKARSFAPERGKWLWFWRL